MSIALLGTCMPRDSHLPLMRVIQENHKHMRQVGFSCMPVTLPNDLSYALMIRLKCENLKSVMQFILSQECLGAVWFCGKFGSGNSDCF
jgi:hypothetical protein